MRLSASPLLNTPLPIPVPSSADTFAQAPGSELCTVCPQGSVSSADRTLCIPCDAGTETDGETCVSCPPGYFNPEAGGICRPCGIGTISSNVSALACSPCAYEYTTTREGATRCDGCIEGYFRDPVASDAEWCVKCPNNAYCAGDSIPGTTLLPVPLPGYW